VNNKKFILRKKIGVVVLKNFPTVIHYHSWWWHRDLETIITKRTPIIEHTYFLPHLIYATTISDKPRTKQDYQVRVLSARFCTQIFCSILTEKKWCL